MTSTRSAGVLLFRAISRHAISLAVTFDVRLISPPMLRPGGNLDRLVCTSRPCIPVLVAVVILQSMRVHAILPYYRGLSHRRVCEYTNPVGVEVSKLERACQDRVDVLNQEDLSAGPE